MDPDLRDVCKLLHDVGIRTTPSCAGHSYPRDRFERIWEELKREEGPIRGDGLQVKDSENQKAYLFRDPDYSVPWSSFEDFYREAGAHQNVGYLGILIPPELDAVARRLREDAYRTRLTKLSAEEETGRILGSPLFGVCVTAVDAQQRAAEWRRFTDYVRSTLEETAPGVLATAGDGPTFTFAHCDGG